MGQLCARYFDAQQSRWRAYRGDQGLFEFWLEDAKGAFPVRGEAGKAMSPALLEDIPASWSEAAAKVLGELNLSAAEIQALGHHHACGLIGWSSWCRGVDWRAALEQKPSQVLCELLTVFLVWEWLAVQSLSPDAKASWRRSWVKVAQAKDTDSFDPLWIWQRAYEKNWQRRLETLLSKASGADGGAQTGRQSASAPGVQAVFCIDVRSELLRRHLEQDRPDIQTLGFAGFFGMPITHVRPGPEPEESRLPGLLAPAYRFNESTGSLAEDQALGRTLDQKEAAREAVRTAKYSGLSTFTLVETTGLAWAWKLVRDALNRNTPKAREPEWSEGRLCHRHGGDPLTDLQRIDLAENLLRGMSLTRNFGSLLVLVGHGSHTDNNPGEAGLACGACGGKNGGVNARVAAGLLNDRVVREGLGERGIRIPDHCYAVAAEHCTVTDEVTVLDRHRVPDSHLMRLTELEQEFARAGRAVRRERAVTLGLNGLSDEQLLDALRKRTHNWAEVRPEWGLANNAAIIFARRDRTRGVNLGGRCFLHDYDPEQDVAGGVLEALMTAPMVVANWINLQYFASVTAPDTYGSGNKLLHSVVGGNLGVIEGNGTDLRIGLPIQSVHDGKLWRHEPMRLSVVIDAPEARIRAVIDKHPDVAVLIGNRWLWLYRLGPSGELRPVRVD